MEELKLRSLKDLAAKLTSDIALADRQLAHFTDSLSLEPVDAFTWGDGTVEAACKRKVLKKVAIMVDDAIINIDKFGNKYQSKKLELAHLTTIKSIVLNHLLHASRGNSQSTLVMTNLVENYTRCAWGEFYMTILHEEQ